MINREDIDVVSRSGLAGVLIVIVAALLWALFNLDMPSGNRDAIMLVIGAVLTRMSDVYSYYYGDSLKSTRKDATISTLASTAQAAQAALPSSDTSIVLKEGESATATATPAGTVIEPKASGDTP